MEQRLCQILLILTLFLKTSDSTSKIDPHIICFHPIKLFENMLENWKFKRARKSPKFNDRIE